jgi:phage tail tube protein FII
MSRKVKSSKISTASKQPENYEVDPCELKRTKLFSKLFTLQEVGKALDEGRVKLRLGNLIDGVMFCIYFTADIDSEDGTTTSALFIDCQEAYTITSTAPTSDEPKRWATVKVDKVTHEKIGTTFGVSDESAPALMAILVRLDTYFSDVIDQYVKDGKLYDFPDSYHGLCASSRTDPENTTLYANLKVDFKKNMGGPFKGISKTTFKIKKNGKLVNYDKKTINGKLVPISIEELPNFIPRGSEITTSILAIDGCSYGRPKGTSTGHSINATIIVAEIEPTTAVSIVSDNKLLQSMMGDDEETEEIEEVEESAFE